MGLARLCTFCCPEISHMAPLTTRETGKCWGGGEVGFQEQWQNPLETTFRGQIVQVSSLYKGSEQGQPGQLNHF